MTRLGKLHARLAARSLLSFAEFCRLLEAFGYRHMRTTGSHRIYRHAGTGDTRVIQPNGKAAKRYQVDQFIDKIEQLGLTLEE